MAKIENGSVYRSIIDGEFITRERSVSFEPDAIKIIIYGDYSVYQEWLSKKGKEINFKITNTDVDLQLIISYVILSYQMEEVVEIVLKLETKEVVERRKEWLKL